MQVRRGGVLIAKLAPAAREPGESLLGEIPGHRPVACQAERRRGELRIASAEQRFERLIAPGRLAAGGDYVVRHTPSIADIPPGVAREMGE